MADGVNFLYGCSPLEIREEGVIYQQSTFVDGRAVPVGEGTLLPSDSVIVAVSQGALNRIVSTTDGLETNDKGLLIADELGRTSRPGVFASGDVVSGARNVVEAVSYSKKVADAMDEYLKNLGGE